MQNRTCTVDNCGGAELARGWCAMHYRRWKRNGDPMLATQPKPPCAVEGCERSVRARGLCDLHYQRQRAGHGMTGPAICAKCGGAMPANKRINAIYCSKPCLNKAMRDSTTRRCIVDGCSRLVRAKDRCVTHYNAMRREIEPEDRAVRNGDPARRAASLLEKTRFRNSVMRASDADVIDAVALGNRDGWTCGICDEPIDKTIAYPDRMAATIDHIVPISHGGRHRWDNVQISHFACNMLKADKAA